MVDSADRADTTKNGGRLIIDSCSIASCDIWKGITVQGQQYLGGRFNHQSATLTMSHTDIHDAVIGVRADYYAYIYINKCKFENNYNHVAIISCWEMDGYIDSTQFSYLLESSNTVCYYASLPSYQLSAFRKQLYIEYSSQIRFLNDTAECFNLNGFQTENAFEIHAVQSSPITVATYGLKITDCKFLGDFNYGIYINEPHYVYIDGTGLSEFTGNFNQAIYLQNFTDINIENQTITNTSSNPTGGGVYMKTGMTANVKNCSLDHLIRGIEFYDNSVLGLYPPISYIKENNINHCIYGISSASSEFPVGTGAGNSLTNRRLLKMQCNQILNCDYGIIGSGPIVDQGSASGGSGGNFEDWSNRFCSNFSSHACQGPSSSTYADLVWWNNDFRDSFNLYVDTLTSFRELKALTGSITLDNNFIDLTNYWKQYHVNVPSVNQSIDYFCIGGLYNIRGTDHQGIAKISKDILSNIKIYPNPVQDELFIEQGEINSGMLYIEISDLLGKILYQSASQSIISMIPVYEYPQGLYIVKIKKRDSERYISYKVNIIH